MSIKNIKNVSYFELVLLIRSFNQWLKQIIPITMNKIHKLWITIKEPSLWINDSTTSFKFQWTNLLTIDQWIRSLNQWPNQIIQNHSLIRFLNYWLDHTNLIEQIIHDSWISVSNLWIKVLTGSFQIQWTNQSLINKSTK